jgi:hypothetical protein
MSLVSTAPFMYLQKKLMSILKKFESYSTGVNINENRHLNAFHWKV